MQNAAGILHSAFCTDMLYLFHGPDEFSRSEALAAMRAAVPGDLADLNISRLEGRRLKLDALAAACEAMPFLAERRLVIVSDALKHVKAGKDREELRAYLERVPAFCDLAADPADSPPAYRCRCFPAAAPAPPSTCPDFDFPNVFVLRNSFP